MVKHVVMWKFTKKKDIAIARSAIDGMKGRVPTLLSLETGENFQNGAAFYDLILITEHKDRAQLDAYQADPLHGEVKELLGGLDSQRCAVDFEV